MKKGIVLFAALVFLCSMFTLAVCEETGVSPRIASILNAWNAKDGKELRLRILDYWNDHSDGTHFSWPLNIRLGGTTVDLINEPESWGARPYDLAALAAYRLGLFALALEYGRQALEQEPDDARLRENLRFYESAASESCNGG